MSNATARSPIALDGRTARATVSTVAAIKETYALAPWAGPTGGGVLVATALGLGRWHPTAAPALLPWPQPMALDNHWVLLGES